jgi:hypothetical protein
MSAQARRRLVVLLCVFSTFATSTATTFAGEPSPRRQAELDNVVAGHRSERRRKAELAAARASAMAHWMSEVRASEIALAQTLATAQLAAAQREFMGYQLGRAQQSAADITYQSTSPTAGFSIPGPVILASPTFAGPSASCLSAPAVSPCPTPAPFPISSGTTSAGSWSPMPGAGHMVLMHR